MHRDFFKNLTKYFRLDERRNAFLCNPDGRRSQLEYKDAPAGSAGVPITRFLLILLNSIDERTKIAYDRNSNLHIGLLF